MIFIQAIRYFFMFVLCVFLTSCDIASPVSEPPISRFSLTPRQFISTNKHSITKKTLLVANVLASPGYDTNRMVYVNVPYKLKSYANNAWVAPPATMMQPIIANALRSTHYFKAVVMAPCSGLSHYVLSVRLLVLQQEFLQPTSQVRLVIQATLTDASSNRLLADKLFETTVAAPQNNPYSGVLAANKSAHTLSARLARFVVSVVRRNS